MWHITIINSRTYSWNLKDIWPQSKRLLKFSFVSWMNKAHYKASHLDLLLDLKIAVHSGKGDTKMYYVKSYLLL